MEIWYRSLWFMALVLGTAEIAVEPSVAQPAERRGYLVHNLVEFANQNELFGLHPRQMAAKLARLDRDESMEGLETTTVSLQVRPSGLVVLLVQINGLADDAVASRRTRVEVQQLPNGRWEPRWAGSQFRCRRSPDSAWMGRLCP
jgi:hypothetical protein